MKYIYLIAAFNALFFAILLYQKKPRALYDNILIYWLVYLGLFTGGYGLYSRVLFSQYPLLSACFISLLLLHGPFLYLYITSLINPLEELNYNKLIHFIPFVLFNSYLFAASFFPETSAGIRLDHAGSSHDSLLLFNGFLILTALSGPIYFLLSIKLFKKFDINIFNNFSSAEAINLDWLRKLVYIFGLVWTLLMVAASIHHVFNLYSWIFCTDGIFLSLSIFIILIGYFGLKQKDIFLNPGKESFVLKQLPEKYSGSGLKESDARRYIEKLNTYLEEEKPYLNPELNLPQLAIDVGIPSHYLSQVINEYFKMNFFDYINRQRVEEVKIKIADPHFNHYSILGIAFESGFNSKSAFNRVFKKFTGQTPSEYKKNNTV